MRAVKLKCIFVLLLSSCSSIPGAGSYIAGATLERAVLDSPVYKNTSERISHNEIEINETKRALSKIKVKMDTWLNILVEANKIEDSRLLSIEKSLYEIKGQLKSLTKKNEDGGDHYVQKLKFDPFYPTYGVRRKLQLIPTRSGQQRRHSWEYPAL